MDNKEHQTCGQGVFLDCLGLKVVGGETSALYTYALLIARHPHNVVHNEEILWHIMDTRSEVI